MNIKMFSEVKTIVTHADCADGIASALILKDALPDARVVFVQYNTQAHRDLVAEPGLLFSDMTPPAARVQEFVDAGAIVLDHHRGARELVEAFGERGIFADERLDPGVSGALLAYAHVWAQVRRSPDPDVQRFAVLAGVRDTWLRASPLWSAACAQGQALLFWPWQTLADRGLRAVVEGDLLNIGDVLIRKAVERDDKSIAEAHRFTVGGVRVVAFEGLRTSDVADRLADDADLVLGWHYQVENTLRRMIVSCRSRGTFSALAFAKANGGGGHEQAAGFTIDLPTLAPAPDPYTHLERLVALHVGRG